MCKCVSTDYQYDTTILAQYLLFQSAEENDLEILVPGCFRRK